MPPSSPKPRTVREQNVDRTRQAILDAAQILFATRGYAEAGVRDIAAKAGANPALIARYYGSKLELFEAALEASLDVSLFTSVDRASFGEHAAEAFFKTRPDAASVIPMLVFSASDSQARQVALKLLARQVIRPLEIWFDEPEAIERTAQLMAVITGFYTYRLMLPLEPLKGRPSRAMRDWLVRTLQEIVDR
jgi:AcrR family transcriptional regulator